MLRLVLVIVFSASTAKLLSAQGAAAEPQLNAAEVGFATGKVLRCQNLRRQGRQIFCQLSGSDAEQNFSTDEVIFIRNAQGEYEFIFPDEAPAAANTNAVTPGAPPAQHEALLLAGVGLGLSDNSDLTAFALDYARSLAADYNARLTPAGFVAQPGLEAAKLSAQFYLEYRYLRGDYALGLSAHYLTIPKSSAVVSSAFYTGQETVNVDGYALPVCALFYYRLWGDRDLGLHVGIGGGALFASVLLTRNYGNNSTYEEARSLTPMLQLTPELQLRVGALIVTAAAPLFWAEGRSVGGEITGVQTGSRVAAASITGAGLRLAVGYGF